MSTHLWQTTFFALAVALLTVACRRNRAQIRYWLWLSASLKFFLPFALLLNLGSRLETLLPAARPIATPAVSYAIEQFSAPFFPESLPSPTPAPASSHWIPIALLTAWLCGFAAVALIRFRNWFRVRNAVRASSPIDMQAGVEVRTSPGLLEPGVVGFLRPILLLPEGIEECLTPSELKAVLAHEFCHIRRRDNFFATIHMFVEAIFWFHPLVWWIGSRLVEERERACDEEVLSLGNQPDVYADAILSVCKLYVESPLACVSGVSGAGIRRRIEAIMANRRVPGLNRTKKFLLASAGALVLAGPVAIGLVIGVGHIPVLQAQSSAGRVAQPPAIEIAQAPPSPVKPAISHSPRVRMSGLDVASIKPCSFADAPLVPGGRGGRGGRSLNISPGRLNIGCMTVSDLINVAYKSGGDPLANDSTGPFDEKRLRGGPAWVYSERYTIEAATDSAAANGTTGFQTAAEGIMSGPMLQRLLEERFQLQTHREIETIPAYALTAARSGFKLKPMAPGDCIPDAPMKAVLGAKPRCGWTGRGTAGPNMILVQGGVSLAWFSQVLGDLILDCHVVDNTGIAGTFVIQLEYSPDDSTPDRPGPGRPVRSSESSDIPPGPTIFTALEQQLGLRLEATKAPHGYIVIDHVEKPSEN